MKARRASDEWVVDRRQQPILTFATRQLMLPKLMIDFFTMADQLHCDQSVLTVRFVNHAIIAHSQLRQPCERSHKRFRLY